MLGMDTIAFYWTLNGDTWPGLSLSGERTDTVVAHKGFMEPVMRLTAVLTTSLTINKERYVRCVGDGLLYDDDVETAFWHTFDHLKLCAENGVVFNKEKFRFARETVEFAGFDVTPNGYRPSERTIQAIRDFPTPTSIKDVKSWLGLV